MRNNRAFCRVFKNSVDAHLEHIRRKGDSSVGRHGIEQFLRIDSRPSDGIAIATRVKCPIYADESVMEAAAQNASFLEPDDDDDDDGEKPF